MAYLRIVGGALVLALAISACGDTDTADTTTSTMSPTTTTTAATTPTTTPTTGAGADATLPGEPFDIGPQAGDKLGVVGVDADDVLNVRAAPGTDQDIVETLDPTGSMVATGENRLVAETIWYEIEVDAATGWVSSVHVGYLGATDDVTAWIIDEMGERTAGETMLDLGAAVADHVAGDDEGIRVTVTVAPSVGDLGEVTYDVVGLPDDSVLGMRLHIFGEPGDENFQLRTVEQTILCRRGVTDDGLCV